MGADRYNHENDERVAASSLTRISKVDEKAWGRDIFGFLLGDGLGYAAADYPSMGVVGGFNYSATGTNKDVHISPGLGVNWDTAVTEAYKSPLQWPRVEAAYTSTLADEAGGQEKWYVYSVPATEAALGTTTDNETSDYNAAGSDDVTQATTAKRLTWATSITQTAGGAAAIGAATEPATPAGHIKLFAVRKEATNNLPLWPLATYTLPGTASYIANVRDYRKWYTFKNPLKVSEQDGTTVAANPGNQTADLMIPKAGGLFEGAGAANPVPKQSAGIKSATWVSTGLYELTFTKAFKAATVYWGQATIHEATDKTVSVRLTSATVARVSVRTVGAAPAQANLAAAEYFGVNFFGEQVA